MESLDRLFEVFSEERRRLALYELDRADGPVGVTELAERVHRREGEEGTVDSGEFDEVVLTLKHTHLPKASRAEYIEYDREAGEITVSGEPAEFEIILTVCEAVEEVDEGRAFDPESLTPQEFLDQITLPGRSSG